MKFGQRPKEKSVFLKLKDGESAVGVFRGELHEFYSRKDGQKNVPCNPDDLGAKFRFKINFVINDNGQYVAKIWEQGAKMHETLEQFNNDYPLENTIVKISRKGDKLETTYTILPNPKGHLVSPIMEDALSKVQLHDLRKGTVPEDGANYGPAPEDFGQGHPADDLPHDDIPF